MAVEEKIDYLSQAAAAADKVYAKVVALGCIHESGSKTYDQMVSNKTVTCAASASISYQEAGILDIGKMVNHLDAVGGTDANILKLKPTIAKAMTGAANVPADKADVVYVGKRYARRPACRIPAKGRSLRPGQQRLHLRRGRGHLQLQQCEESAQRQGRVHQR